MIDSATSAARWLIVWTVWLWGPASLIRLCAEDPSLPSWQQGISAWNGSGYDLPTNQSQSTNLDAAAQFGSTQSTPVQITPVQICPVATANTTPYVMPTDPSAPRINPYAELAEKNDNAPLQMTVPYIASNPNPTITFAPPQNAAKHDETNTPIQIPTPIPLPKPLPKRHNQAGQPGPAQPGRHRHKTLQSCRRLRVEHLRSQPSKSPPLLQIQMFAIPQAPRTATMARTRRISSPPKRWWKPLLYRTK